MWDRGNASTALVAAVVGAVVGLSGCEAGLGTGGEAIPIPEPGEAPGPDHTREDDTPFDQAEEPLTDKDPAVDECDDEEFEALDATIGDQIGAFADGDWERAHQLTSRDYRQGVTVEEFAALIEEQFPALADPHDHTSAECLTDGTRTSILVTVSGRAGESHTFLYLLGLEDGDWRVSGATASAAPEPGDV